MQPWIHFTNQKQWESYLKNLIKVNDRALLKSITLIYNNQTNEEKDKGESIEENKIGFSKIDAYEMGKIAIKIKEGKPLTKGELAKSRNKMQKYWKQLMIISKRKMKAEEEFRKSLDKITEVIKTQWAEYEEILSQCLEGKSCSYGICSECPKCLENGGI